MTTAAVLAEFEPLRMGLAHALTAAGIDVIRQAHTIAQIVDETAPEAPDVQVMELRALGPDLEALEGLDGWLQRQRIVLLGSLAGVSPASPPVVRLLTEPKSVAFVGSEGNVARLIEIVRMVADGLFVADMDTLRPMFARLSLFAGAAQADASAEQLSPREIEVLRLVAQGMDNRTIAADLSLSEGTVKAHVSHILAKLAVRTRAELVRYALTTEVIPFELQPDDEHSAGMSARVHRHITLRFTAGDEPSNTSNDPADDPRN